MNEPPIHNASPAIAKTAINTNIAETINIALPIFHVVLPLCFFMCSGETLDHVDLGGK